MPIYMNYGSIQGESPAQPNHRLAEACQVVGVRLGSLALTPRTLLPGIARALDPNRTPEPLFIVKEKSPIVQAGLFVNRPVPKLVLTLFNATGPGIRKSGSQPPLTITLTNAIVAQTGRVLPPRPGVHTKPLEEIKLTFTKIEWSPFHLVASDDWTQ
jgi:hypothetical protein